MNCIEFFTKYSDDPDKCKKLSPFVNELDSWEKQPASHYSPGVVEDIEIILRQIQDPRNLSDDKTSILPNCMEDVTNKGLSCHRLQHSSIKRLEKIATQRADSAIPKRTFVGFIEFKVDEIRKLLSSGRRPVFIFDTANEHDESHCDVCQISLSKLERREIREILFKLSKNNLNLKLG